MTRDNSTPAEFLRELNMTEPEESVLVKMATYFLDMGWIDAVSYTHLTLPTSDLV